MRSSFVLGWIATFASLMPIFAFVAGHPIALSSVEWQIDALLGIVGDAVMIMSGVVELSRRA